jgi:hypothetical protein
MCRIFHNPDVEYPAFVAIYRPPRPTAGTTCFEQPVLWSRAARYHQKRLATSARSLYFPRNGKGEEPLQIPKAQQLCYYTSSIGFFIGQLRTRR